MLTLRSGSLQENVKSMARRKKSSHFFPSNSSLAGKSNFLLGPIIRKDTKVAFDFLRLTKLILKELSKPNATKRELIRSKANLAGVNSNPAFSLSIG